MSPVMPLVTALLLGMQHALEVDHLVAVTTFVSRKPALRAAAGFGARWGFGHAAAVLVFGGVLLLTGVRLAPRMEAFGELLVGVMLLFLGARAIRSARLMHMHAPAIVHAHLEATASEPHAHPHGVRGAGVTWVGLTHGLAGTSAVVALVPALVGSRIEGVGYLLAFGLGTMAAMSAAAVAAALAVRRAQRTSLAWARAATLVVGGAALVVGAVWLVRAGAAVLKG